MSSTRDPALIHLHFPHRIAHHPSDSVSSPVAPQAMQVTCASALASL
jgi:hypothetical protein